MNDRGDESHCEVSELRLAGTGQGDAGLRVHLHQVPTLSAGGQYRPIPAAADKIPQSAGIRSIKL